jgi:hypothetical protein
MTVKQAGSGFLKLTPSIWALDAAMAFGMI